MKKIIHSVGDFGFIPILFYIALLAVGGFHEFVSCLLCAALAVGLLIRMIRQKQWRIPRSLPALAAGLIALFYGLSILWALDRGMAWIGFLKYLPLPLFYLCYRQQPEAKQKILQPLPYVAAAMAAVSALLMQIPALHTFFAVDGRLSGFFQYPNTFALFLLVAELLLLGKEHFRWYDFLVLAALLGGLLYSGSRTVFVLAVAANLAAAFFVRNRKVRFGILGLLGGAALPVALAALLGGAEVLERLSSLSLGSSTFLGRFLYFQDALPLILKHPFGMGYWAYYSIQQEIQSGLYSVAFMHNDFLHMMLEIGWLPALSLAVAGLAPLFSKKVGGLTKIILCTMFLHFCFDFDLQFIAIFWLYLLLAEPADTTDWVVCRGRLAIGSAAALIAAAALYMAIPLGLNLAGNHKAASRLYGYHTPNETALLTETTDMVAATIRAEKLLKQNPYVPLAYSVRARNYYEQGDFGALMETKREIFEKFPFLYEEYEEYGYMLINGMLLYEQAGDSASAEVCRQELAALPQLLKQCEERLSPLGKRILDQPQTELPQEILGYIAETEVSDE